MFIDILYYTFIFPLQGVLGFALDSLHSLTHNYGLSIILLSLLVNLFLLKLAKIAESKATKINALKSVCDKKIAEFKRVFKGAELQSYIRILYKQKHYHPIFALSALGGLALQVPFFIAVLCLLQEFEGIKGVSFLWISDLSAPDSVLGVHLLPILMTIISLVNVWIVAKERGAKIQGAVISLIFLVLLYQMPSALVLYWSTNMLFSLLRAIWGKWFGNLSLDKRINKLNPQLYRQISTYATLCITFLICVFTPYQLYNTDITQFDSAEMVATLSTLFGTFIISAFAIIYILSFIPKRFSKVVAFVLNVILFSGIVYSFILVGDYGAMDHFILQRPPENEFMQIVEWFCVLLSGSALVFFTFKKLLRATQIIFITLFIVSGVNVFQIIDKQLDFSLDSTKNTESTLDSTNSLNAPIHLPYENELFSYSKNDKNIIVIVLDMFSGSHTTHILEQFPQFKTQLDGFTLYPNAISTTNSTIHSMATLIGGEHYATYNMNKRKQNLINEIDKAFIDTTNAFAQDNFSVAMMAFVGTNVANLKSRLHNKIFALDSYSEAFLDYYINEENLAQSIKINNAKNAKYSQKIRLISFGIFKFAPKALHYKIYRNGAWLSGGDMDVLFALGSIKNSASFYALTHILNTNAKNPTFKYYHSMMTHLSYGMYFNNDKCEFYGKKTAWEDYPHNATMIYPKWSRKKNFYQHYDTEVCALKYLSDYIQSLKKLGIYDNTQIFVVSDHSGNDNINIPVLDKYDTRPDSLFLFKDFGTSGDLKIDSRLMANYDIASIFCENLPNGCPNVPPNILKNYPQDRELIHTIPIAWQIEKHKENEWLLNKAYKVKGSIYDPKNWTDISDESYGIVNTKK